MSPPSNILCGVAMSGGVDSSVAALLVRDAGFRAVGLTMKLWEPDGDVSTDRTCCTIDSAFDAKRVCERLGIPHYTLDMRDDFRRHVVDPFVEGYLRGETPNPCVECNTRIKWDALWSKVRALGGSRLATGHYARIVPGDRGHELHRGEDADKDQSYFLWGIPQTLLAHTDFPLASIAKADTRALAAAAGLPTARKGESQDVCFIPGGDYRVLLEREAAGRSEALLEPGPIIGPEGRILGTHRGLARYTIGQRRGIGVAGREPLYVVALDMANNTLRLGNAADLGVQRLRLRDTNWLVDPAELEEIASGPGLSVQVRYRSRPVPCRLLFESLGSSDSPNVVVDLLEPAASPACGQSMVVYLGSRVVGGGILAATPLAG